MMPTTKRKTMSHTPMKNPNKHTKPSLIVSPQSAFVRLPNTPNDAKTMAMLRHTSTADEGRTAAQPSLYCRW